MHGCGVLLALTPADLPFYPDVIFCVCSPTSCTFSQAHLNLGSLTAQTLNTFSGGVSCFDLPEFSSLLLICVMFQVGGKPISPLWKGFLTMLWMGNSAAALLIVTVLFTPGGRHVFHVLPVAGITMHFFPN